VAGRKTLGQFLDQATFEDAASSLQLRALLHDLAAACKAIARRLGDAPLRTASAQGTPAGKPSGRHRSAIVGIDDRLSDDRRRVWIARLRSGGGNDRRSNACHLYRGRYRAVLLPVDSPPNVEVNAPGGTIFSILRSEVGTQLLPEDGVRRAGRAHVCSGYAIHGASLVLVLALEEGVQAFALDRQKDEFVLTHTDLRIPAATDRIAIDASRMRFWNPPIRRYVEECLAGKAGPRGKDFNAQWQGSIVVEAHRILMRGGIFVCPGNDGKTEELRRDWLMQEANPISFVIEKAGGRASTGTTRIFDIRQTASSSRPALIFGSVEEVERLEAYHSGHFAGSYDAPLFAERGLFRSSV